MIDLLEIPGFVPDGEREELLAELRAIPGTAATVLSPDMAGRVQPSVRKTTRLAVSPETRDRMKERLMNATDVLAARFGVALGDCEDPQFLRYEEGDFFVPHQDGNTSLVYDASRFRRVSTVIFLNERSDEPREGTYGGGPLVLHGDYRTDPDRRVEAPADPGTLVAFRSETTHEVTPVTHGVRYTIACFFRTADAP
ncbi:MAG TPA: 2OG-Fe(II) oxygenase [Longimicrobium sp.]|jgi:SM-20-related protein|uniref:2OG-Fe(II) oxygenase n=1 Tax=Longimicrobium sp. TaxID=2029185 RepID=UPI002ED9565A